MKQILIRVGLVAVSVAGLGVLDSRNGGPARWRVIESAVRISRTDAPGQVMQLMRRTGLRAFGRGKRREASATLVPVSFELIEPERGPVSKVRCRLLDNRPPPCGFEGV